MSSTDSSKSRRTPNRRAKHWIVLAALSLLLVGVAFWSLGSGAVSTSAEEVWTGLTGDGEDSQVSLQEVVIREIRLPRVISGILVGAALSLSGALLQGLFRNPLADPALIGVSSGAAMGGVLALVLLPLTLTRLAQANIQTPQALVDFFDHFGLPVFAMAGAVGLTFTIYRISLVRGRINVPAMLLTGIAANAIGGAFVGLLVTMFATDDQLRSVTFWTLGSLAGSNWTSTLHLTILIIPCAFFALRYDRALNSFLLGEAEAFHLGIQVHQVKRAVILLSALMVGITVAFCGIIGFVGLVVPHMIRTVFGPDHRLLLPAGALLGSILLLIADVFARTAVAPSEIQIGILTSLIGGPFFLALLLKARKGASSIGL
ncbi:FecCD family ABC transporter permease [Puniceicoccus vermicola]|uniref:FecCD family ABC transporter permease n=1 Tax=Puniceicoccus vermicola TaxID=388746 RepID=UPI001C8B848F